MVGITSRRARLHRGVGLIDILLALMVLAAACFVLVAAFSRSSEMTTKARHLDRALNACYAELNAWREAGYTSIPAGSGTATLTGSSLAHPLPTDLPNVSGQLAVQWLQTTGTAPTFGYQNATTDPGRAQLTMRVGWTGQGADFGSATVTALVLK